MKKVTVYFKERNKRLGLDRARSRVVEVPDGMFDEWDWSGIKKIFLAGRGWYDDSTVMITGMKIGRAMLR